EKFVDFFVTIFTGLGRVILKIMGFFLLFIGLCCFLGLLFSAFGTAVIGNLPVHDWVEMFLLDGKDLYLGTIGLFLFLVVPILGMIYGGMKLLFKFSYTNRWMNLSASIFWLIGLLMLLYVGIRTGRDFNKTAKVREKVEIAGNYSQLNLQLHE